MRRSRHSAVTTPHALTRPPEAAAVMARLCPGEATREQGTTRRVDEVDTIHLCLCALSQQARHNFVAAVVRLLIMHGGLYV